MNQLHVVRLADGRLRVTIISEGVAFQNVTLTENELDDLIDAAEAETAPDGGL